MSLVTRLIDRFFPLGPPPINLEVARARLAAARVSLAAFLSSQDPKDIATLSFTRHKYDILDRLYAALEASEFDYRSPGFPFDRLPNGRDLFWDEPETALQARCLEDAEALSMYLREVVIVSRR